MPKELIDSAYQGSTYRSHDECPDGPDGRCVGMGGELPCVAKVQELTQEPVIKVGWNKDSSNVELAVLAVDPEDGRLVEHGWVPEVEHTLTSEQARLTPIYAQLDRRTINRIIRVLKQARDDAFGKDE